MSETKLDCIIATRDTNYRLKITTSHSSTVPPMYITTGLAEGAVVGQQGTSNRVGAQRNPYGMLLLVRIVPR